MCVCILQPYSNPDILSALEEQRERLLRVIHQVQLKSSYKRNVFFIVVLSFIFFFLAMKLFFFFFVLWSFGKL